MVEIIVARELLTAAWADALHGGESGGHGAILSGHAGFEGLLFLERLPAQTLDATQAYPLVESALVEQNLQQSFEAWLGKAVEASVILVSERLLHKKDDEDLPPEPSAGEKDQQGVASGNETG